MNGFKLLAIRPLEGCDKRFRKKLKEGMVYKFFQDYKYYIEVAKRKKVELTSENYFLYKEISISEVVPPSKELDLFSSDSLNINVSAIVGENGSGKSSLIDFHNTINYYLASYCFKTMDTTLDAVSYEIKKLISFTDYYMKTANIYLHEKFDKTDIDIGNIENQNVSALISDLVRNIVYINQIHSKNINLVKSKHEFFNACKKCYNTGVENVGFTPYNLNMEGNDFFSMINLALIDKLSEKKNAYLTESQLETTLKERFNFQLFYSKSSKVYCITKNKNGFEIDEKNHKFYYSILLNYSLHSLNSNQMGNWIHSLFHKNDGYQTPLVINPLRKNGNIDINNELKLSVDRLAFNVIDQLNHEGSASILNKYRFLGFVLKLKENKRFYPFRDLDFNIQDKDSLFEFLSKNPVKFNLIDNNANIQDYSIGYLIKKFRKIAITYIKYFYKYDYKNSSKSSDEQVNNLEKWTIDRGKVFIRNNDTHITKKFFQTYNFLVNYKLYSNQLPFIKEWDVNDKIELSASELIDWIECIKKQLIKANHKSEDFSTDLIYSNLFPSIFDIDIKFDHQGKVVRLSDLSSGEQQYIFNLNTISYHINNLKSIKPIEGSKNNQKIYNEVNIILDEIELYYHPQLQKHFVKDVLNSIKSLDSFGKLRNVNILLLSHSPFILSDIPSSNILRLKDGLPQEEVEQTFAANIHDLLANDFFLKNSFIGEFANNYIKQLIVNFHKQTKLKKLSKEEAIKYHDQISIIGEIFIKQKLTEMVIEKTELSKFEKLQSIIEFKQKEILKLKEAQSKTNRNDKDK